MSIELARSSVSQALARMNMKQVLINPSYSGLMTDMSEMLNCKDDSYAEKALANVKDQLCETYGVGRSSADKPFAFSNGLAIIPIHGTLINRYGGYYGGYVTGYNFIRRQMNEAMVDDDVRAIIFDVNSNGGEAAGCFELCDEIFAARASKPSMAIVDSNSYSAAYALASSATKMSVIPSGGAGSIGVISMHMDMSKMLDAYGISITLITAGDHKADGHPYAPLPKDVRADIQASVDATRDVFVSTVARNRGLDEKVVHDTQAQCYSAQDALALGLIDMVAVPNDAANAFLNSPSDSDNGANSMTTATNAAAPVAAAPVVAAAPTPEQLASAQAAGQTAERARISGIQSCEAATGRSQLANHLAFNTSMSIVEATAILEKAAVETPAAAAATTTEPVAAAPAVNPFAAAMGGAEQPNIGANGADPAASAEVNPLMADYTLATGYDFNQK